MLFRSPAEADSKAASPSAVFESTVPSQSLDAPDPSEPDGEATIQDETLVDAPSTEPERSFELENDSKSKSPLGDPVQPPNDDDVDSLAIASEEPSSPKPEPLPIKFEIILRPLSTDARDQYETVHSDIVDFIVSEIPEDSGDCLYRLEFTDGTQDTVSSTCPLCPSLPFFVSAVLSVPCFSMTPALTPWF